MFFQSWTEELHIGVGCSFVSPLQFHTLPAPTPLKFPHLPFTFHGKTESAPTLEWLHVNMLLGTINESRWY